MEHDVCFGSGAVLLTTRAMISIGDYVMSGPNLTIITGDHRIEVLDRPTMYFQMLVSFPVTIRM